MPVKRSRFSRARRAKPIAKSQMSSQRRRLVPGAVVAGAGLAVAKAGYTRYQRYKAGVRAEQAKLYRKSVQVAKDRMSASDTIQTLPATTVGKAKKLSFDEKVSRVENPPVVHNWKYSFTAEGQSGRKAWFGYSVNESTTLKVVYNKLKDLSTDTSTANAIMADTNNSSLFMQYKYSIEYLSSRLQLINSSSNSLTGNIRLVRLKRDLTNNTSGAGTNFNQCPINHMMYASANSLITINGASEGTVGNGFAFSTLSTPAPNSQNTNYTANFQMPGSNINSTGVCAFTDQSLDFKTANIKDYMDYYFAEVDKVSISLKPGQQVDKWFKFYDRSVIHRQMFEQEYIKGVTYWIIVDFEGGIIGDSATTDVSTGTTQLSVIRTDKMVMDTHYNKRPKLIQYTAGLPTVALANQVTINPDTGIQDTGADIDV